ncbi:MAG: hypothetical protein H6994_00505 [Pseudomonadales bacterium]|nr:hypothetical protein [Pseudomonadales bacterium]
MYETLEAIGQVAIGVAGFSGVIVFLQERDNVADFRLRSLISLAAEVIFFSFLPPLLSLVVAQEWKVAALIYAVVHAGQIVWSFVNYRGLDADRSAGYIPLDNVLMGIGALFSVALVACALLAPVNITQFGYTALLLWALGIAGVQFIRIVLRRRWNDGT